MNKKYFSINTSGTPQALSKLRKKRDDMQERLDNIYAKAVIKDVPIVQSVVSHFDPSPEECVMLSKVFARLAQYLQEYKDLNDKIKLLEGIDKHSDWLYDQVGDTSRDIDSFLNSITNESSTTESTD